MRVKRKTSTGLILDIIRCVTCSIRQKLQPLLRNKQVPLVLSFSDEANLLILNLYEN